MTINVDLFLTNFIYNLPHNFILNSFFGFFSIKGMSFFIWILIFLYLVFFEEKKHKEFIIFFLLSLVVSAFLVNVIIKNLVGRPRPLYQIPNSNPPAGGQIPNSSYPTDFSFPSSHAATSFAAATILAYFDKKRKKVFYIIATLIAFSRVYLGYHYFFDVVFGSFLGWLISMTILSLRIGEVISKIKYQISNIKITY